MGNLVLQIISITSVETSLKFLFFVISTWWPEKVLLGRIVDADPYYSYPIWDSVFSVEAVQKLNKSTI